MHACKDDGLRLRSGVTRRRTRVQVWQRSSNRRRVSTVLVWVSSLTAPPKTRSSLVRTLSLPSASRAHEHTQPNARALSSPCTFPPADAVSAHAHTTLSLSRKPPLCPALFTLAAYCKSGACQVHFPPSALTPLHKSLLIS